MKYDIEDCRIWLEQHKNYLIANEIDYTTPIVEYTPSALFAILSDMILPNLTCEQLIGKSFSRLFSEFWDGEGGCKLVNIEEYMAERSANTIIEAMVISKSDADEIRKVLRIVLRLSNAMSHETEAEKHIINESLRIYNSFHPAAIVEIEE